MHYCPAQFSYLIVIFFTFYSRIYKMLDLIHPTGERLFPREKLFVDLLKKEKIHVMWACLNIGCILEDLFYNNIAINDIWYDKIILFIMHVFFGNHLMHVFVLHAFFSFLLQIHPFYYSRPALINTTNDKHMK